MTDLLKSFIAGWIGGIGNLAVGHPFDTVKTLMQNSKEKTGALELVTTLVKNEGPLAVYKGVCAPMAGVGAVFALYFFAYDTTEKLIRQMRSLPPGQQLSMAEVLVCGGSTGIVGSIVLGPAELIKIRQQTASSMGLDGSFNAVVKQIRTQHGYLGFYRGFTATCMRDVPGSMAWFGAYEFTKKAVCEDPKKPTVPQALLAGGMGGLGMWSFAIPLDVVKTRVQASREGGRMSIPAAFRAIAKEQGIKGFYRGIVPALLRAFPANAATFAAKELAQSTLDKVF